MASITFLKGRDEIAKQNLDLVSSGSIVVFPMSDSYTPDKTAQDFISDINADELTATDYDGGFGGAGRKTPSGRTLRRDNAAERIEFDFDTITYASLGGDVNDTNDTITGYIIAEERTSDTDSPLVGFIDLADNRDTNGSDIDLSLDAEGTIHFAN